MDSETTILDSELIITEFDPRDCMASSGARFANFLLDLLCFYIFWFLLIETVRTLQVSAMPWVTWAFQVLSICSRFLYYFIFEAVLGKTPAKFITRTKVVNDKGELPRTLTIAGRSLSRLIPFDAFSFLGSYARGWHDRWSNTWVIDERKVLLMRGTES